MKRWLIVVAALAALAVAGVGVWLAFTRGGGGGGAAAPAAVASPLASGSPAASGPPLASGPALASGSPLPSGSPVAAPTPAVALIPLPTGAGHFARAPLPRLVQGPRSSAVPILMYHLIGDPPPGEPYPDLFVSLHDFAAQMHYLVTHGYTAVTLHQLFAYWRGHGSLPAKPVVLSFDDGYRSDWRDVGPILQRIGWPAVLNLCMNAVGPHRDLPVALVRGLVRRGWEVDDHTLTHPNLTTLNAAGLHREIFVSRAVIRHLTGQRVSFFCYPSGAYDATVVRAVRAAGFLGATTTNEGLATRAQPYTLPRVRVYRAMSLADFAQALGA